MRAVSEWDAQLTQPRAWHRLCYAVRRWQTMTAVGVTFSSPFALLVLIFFTNVHWLYPTSFHAKHATRGAATAPTGELLAFLECTSDPGRSWCAKTSRCVSGTYECPDTSAMCRRPLLYNIQPTGLTNQKYNMRDLLAVARASGSALLLTRVAYRLQAEWGDDVRWYDAPWGQAFDAAYFAGEARGDACVFYAPDVTTLSGLPSGTADIVNTNHVADWYASAGDEWREAGYGLVRVLNPWASFAPSSAAELLLFDRVYDWFRPAPLVSAATARITRRLLAEATAVGQNEFYAIHLRVEGDYVAVHGAPPPASVRASIDRCGLPDKAVLFVAGGFGTLKEEMHKNAHIQMLCGEDSPYQCFLRGDLAESVATLPSEFDSFDLGALVQYGVALHPSCALFWGAEQSTFSQAAIVQRNRMDPPRLSTLYDLSDASKIRASSEAEEGGKSCTAVTLAWDDFKWHTRIRVF